MHLLLLNNVLGFLCQDVSWWGLWIKMYVSFSPTEDAFVAHELSHCCSPRVEPQVLEKKA